MKLVVTEQKTRLDKYLATHTDVSRSAIQRAIEQGKVMVNGVVQTQPKFVVRIDDVIDFVLETKATSSIQAKHLPITILYNDHGLLILDKPAGLSVHPGAGVQGDSLTHALLYHFKDIAKVGEEHRPGIVHRLDKDTSGVMLVALTQDMYEYLKDAFAERKVKKEYIALVVGRVPHTHGFIDTPIGKSATDFRKYDTTNLIRAKDSLTEYTLLEYVTDPKTLDEYSLILVKLHTGRTHQIRVHMSSIGHPLMGDALYGNRLSRFPLLKRQFLHARRIEVQLPDGTWIEAESKLPEDLVTVLEYFNSKSLTDL